MTTGTIVGIAVGGGCALAAAVVVVLTLRWARQLRAATAQLAQGAPPAPAAPRPELTTSPVELAASLDPNDVIERTLDLIVALPGVDAGLVSLEGGLGADGSVRTSASGLSEDEVERTLLHMPAHPDLRALEVVYRYRLEDVNGTSRLPRSALTVALRAEGETIGSLAAISRSDVTFSDEVENALENLARRAGKAIWNALRYTEAKELAELDPLTSLYNRRLFDEFLGREIARARRYERSLSLIVFDVDDFKRINDRLGHPAGDAVLIAIAESMRSVIRESDIACRFAGDEFCVIVPESSRDDAEALADRIALAIRQQKVEKVGALRISAGVAELRPTDAAEDLFKRADDALLRAKGDGKGRIVAN